MYLSLLVTVSGACVMILEIVASRFFAPYIGTSIVVWTSLIGIVMAGLSIGYATGGALADRWKSVLKLRLLVGLAALWTLLLAVMRDPVLETLTQTFEDPLLISVLGTVILLLFPSVLLGMVSPYAVRLVARDIEHVGRTAGRLSALSTIGSIAGTFLAGIVLIPLLGTTTILLVTALTLLLVAALPLTGRSVALSVLFLALSFGVSQLEGVIRTSVHARNHVLAEEDTPYSVARVRTIPADQSVWEREVMYLEIDHGYHAAKFTDGDDHVFEYVPFYALANVARPEISRALLLGGGGYTVARDFLNAHPQGEIDVVEIDPQVTDLAGRYFAYAPDARLRVSHEDARTFINRQGMPGERGEEEGSYHVVYGDTCHSEYTVPFHLTTKEAAERIFALLDDEGVYVLNIIAAKEGKRSRFFKSEVATLREVFPTVLAFEVPFLGRPIDDPLLYRNYVLFASKKEMAFEDLQFPEGDPLREMAENALVRQIDLSDAIVLTDDYAPVEAMLNL